MLYIFWSIKISRSLAFFWYVKCHKLFSFVSHKSEVTWKTVIILQALQWAKKATLWSFARGKKQPPRLGAKRQSCIFVCFSRVPLEGVPTVNLYFLGDATEDPSHPKIVWPTPSDCPECRSDRTDLLNFDLQIAFVQGTLWNLTNLVEHNIKVYAGQHLRPIDLTAFNGNFQRRLLLTKLVQKL